MFYIDDNTSRFWYLLFCMLTKKQDNLGVNMKIRDYVITSLVGIYIFCLPLATASRLEWILSLIFVLIGIIYLVELILLKDYRVQFIITFKQVFSDTFTIIFILFVIIMFISTLYSKEFIISVKELARYIYYIGIYFVIRFRINKEDMYEGIIKIYMLGAFIVAIFGIYEVIGYFKNGLNIDQIILNSRVKSTFEHHNTYAAYLILAIFPSVLSALGSKGTKKIYYSLLSILLSFNLAFTFSKNGWIAFAVGILILSILYSWKFISLYPISALLLLTNGEIRHRTMSILNSAYSDSRIKIWKIAESMIKENMFLGVGSGNFRTMYAGYVKKFPELELNETLSLPPHNSYIRVFAEIGVFGSIVFLIMCFEMLKTIYYAREKCHGFIKYFYSGFLISTTCFLMMNCFDDLFYTPKVTAVYFIFVFIGHNIQNSSKELGKFKRHK